MKLKAIDQRILVEVDTSLQEEAYEGTLIVMTDEFKDQNEGGCQMFTVLDVGKTAFDTASPADQDRQWVGRTVITNRYPGVTIDFNPTASNSKLSRYRMISWDEIGALVVTDDEEGVEVEVENAR